MISATTIIVATNKSIVPYYHTLIAKFVNCYTLETEEDKATINTPSEIHYETLENFNNGKVCYLLNVGGYGRNMTLDDVNNMRFRQTLGGDAAYDDAVTAEEIDAFPVLAGTKGERADVHKAGLFKPEVEPIVNASGDVPIKTRFASGDISNKGSECKHNTNIAATNFMKSIESYFARI